MSKRSVRNEVSFIARRCAPVAATLLGILVFAVPSRAQVALGPVTVGAGMRTSYVHTSEVDTDTFPLNSVRLYVNGPVTEKIKFMFNTEYNSSTNTVNVLDAVARIELHPAFNIWAGRLLPPSDRANLAGPYYNNHWDVYNDGIQNGHPFVFQGRDNGIVWWGDFAKKLKLSAGAFDGASATGRSEVIGAFRAQIDFWDEEGGYYLNSTYYGDKDLLSIGVATQVQSGSPDTNTATTIDFLLEKKLANAGVFTLEGEWANYDGLGGYNSAYRTDRGWYGLASYILPGSMGPGKFQLLYKYSKADFGGGTAPGYNWKTNEFNANYLLKQFNARFMMFVKKHDFSKIKTDFWQAGIGLQIQM
jgi:hypothetical protein